MYYYISTYLPTSPEDRHAIGTDWTDPWKTIHPFIALKSTVG